MVLFYSKTSNLKLTIEPAQQQYLPNGQSVKTSNGKRIEFQGGVYRTEDEEEIEFLRAADGYNSHALGGFFEKGNEPDLPRPTPDEIDEIVYPAVAAGTPEPIEELLEAELEGHKRVAVIESLTKARATVYKAIGEDPPDTTPKAEEPTNA
jgi:hypothetical protein